MVEAEQLDTAKLLASKIQECWSNLVFLSKGTYFLFKVYALLDSVDNFV